MLSGHTIVVYEVALSLSRLVRKYALQLHPLEWELAYDIMEAIQLHIGELQRVGLDLTIGQHFRFPPIPQVSGVPVSGSNHALSQVMAELCLAIEEMFEQGRDIGNPDKFFSLMDNSVNTLPVSEGLGTSPCDMIVSPSNCRRTLSSPSCPIGQV